MKNIVVYFSATGITREVAKEVSNILNCDLLEIKPKVNYTEEDLDWNNPNSRSSLEMKDLSSRPEIIKKLDNLNNYDTIYLGFPIWWGIAPTIVNTFLESYDLSNKTIITFATSGGSNIGESTSKLEVSAKNSKFINGRVINKYNVKEFIDDIK